MTRRLRSSARSLLFWGGFGVVPGGSAAQAPVEIEVSTASAGADTVGYPGALAAGDRLVVEATREAGEVVPDRSGRMPDGALVATFAGSEPFLVGEGRLLWTAPSSGRLAFAVHGRGPREVRYALRVTPLGPTDDPRQRSFPPPHVRFLPAAGDALLAVAYEDRAGFGLDRRSLQVFLETRDGRRVVLSPYFSVAEDGAVLSRLPADLEIPAGLHRVTATIRDALGNVSPPASVFLDRP